MEVALNLIRRMDLVGPFFALWERGQLARPPVDVVGVESPRRESKDEGGRRACAGPAG